ncbi:GIY-YIG nuclease family protein [Agrobacterium vitis]|uniref:GIY-YIG nuclease family protein n=1 Tax=Rhizobium/Agrobacterium group TaxID=227290 RepID=UPI001F1723D8|nr:GIY-YIG nuclease family protein [Agrobacterium vitis]MCF1501707.1 GIY-YIG nuclease family protein [Allorhizobium sp. Av2]MCM2438507.1 GIY-YIG nuclease family protein [Agrobacterium vitis]MCM2473157.1 GIY-YIG nuclease family protein [Rhizobium sp. CG5]
MAKGFTDEDDALLEELGVEVEAKKESSRTPREERVIAGFEEIQRFVEQHGRPPQHGEHRDIFERLYAVRLDRLRERADCRAVIERLDHQGLLGATEPAPVSAPDDLDDDELLAQLGVVDEPSDITELRHVRSAAEKRAAEEIANRQQCEDFDQFKPLFEQVQRDLQNGVRMTRRFVKDAGFLKAEIKAGQFFVLGGQTAYVAEVGEPFKAPNGETDARLRVIYSNGTESDLLLRSLQRALYKDEAGRRISDPVAGPLFADQSEEGDEASGIVYVLRSKSDHPAVAAHRDVLHKIGVTGGDVARRLANAKLDPTFLMADVEVVATYELFNINRTRLENLIHRIFGKARLDIEIKDRFGMPIIPREWFLVPLFVVDEAIEKIRDGTITGYAYDPKTASLTRTVG